jgi:hypothetical protein
VPTLIYDSYQFKQLLTTAVYSDDVGSFLIKKREFLCSICCRSVDKTRVTNVAFLP